MTIARRSVEEHHAIQKPRELEMLIAFLEGRRLRTVLEVGTWKGGTLWLWRQIAASDATIVTIDITPFGCDADQRVHCVTGDAHTLETVQVVKRLLGRRKLDLLFIDGEHSYSSVQADFFAYMPLVRTGGVIGLHDIVVHDDPDVHVAEFWHEIKPDWPGDVHEFVCPEPFGLLGANSGGIGVLIA